MNLQAERIAYACEQLGLPTLPNCCHSLAEKLVLGIVITLCLSEAVVNFAEYIAGSIWDIASKVFNFINGNKK